jgi:hypothetical protein
LLENTNFLVCSFDQVKVVVGVGLSLHLDLLDLSYCFQYRFYIVAALCELCIICLLYIIDPSVNDHTLFAFILNVFDGTIVVLLVVHLKRKLAESHSRYLCLKFFNLFQVLLSKGLQFV